MLSIPSLASTPTTLSLPPSVLATGTTDIVSTRTTAAALPAPLSDQAIADNNAQNTVALAVAPATEDAVATTVASTFGASGSLSGNLSTSGPSSSYLAQLLSQSDDEDTGTTFAPATTYNKLVSYSFIKYKPSNAGVPAPRAPFPSPLPAQQTTTPVVTQPAVPSTTIVSPANQNVPTPATTDTAAQAVTLSEPTADATPVVTSTTSPAVTVPAAPSSVVSQVQAYTQTQSRNQSNLNFAEPQLSVAG